VGSLEKRASYRSLKRASTVLFVRAVKLDAIAYVGGLYQALLLAFRDTAGRSPLSAGEVF